jgi:hypothetical protein
MAGWLDRMELTGRRRYRPTGKGGPRVDAFHEYEYACRDCQWLGWTRHADIARRWRQSFGMMELGRYAVAITTNPGPFNDDTDKADRLRRIVKFAVDNDLYELL